MAKTLYERLGGRNDIAQVVEDAVNAQFNNPIIKTRFENAKDIERAKRMSVDFFFAPDPVVLKLIQGKTCLQHTKE